METQESVLDTLATAIARQVEALESLRFRFEVQQMMLSAGRSRWIGETTRELEGAIASVQLCDEALRAGLCDAAVHAAGLSPEATLREVAEAVGEPWSYIFHQARDELRHAIERVGALCAENRKLLARGFLATSEALALLGVAPAGLAYDASGAPLRAAAGGATLFNARA